MLKNYIAQIQSALQKKANSKTKTWWENYLKHLIEFRGVKMGDIRSVVHSWYKSENIDEKLDPKFQKEIALNLLRERYSEDKLAGTLLIHEILIPKGYINYKSDLRTYSSLFKDDFIFDWSTCDWFCVKVVGSLIKLNGKDCAIKISKWSNSKNLWQKRASLISFVNLAKKGDKNFKGFTDLLLDSCSKIVKSGERFHQTAVGWVLRELYSPESEKVKGFIYDNLKYFSAEGLRYSIEKMTKQEKTMFIKFYKEV